jgi:hypothetical protein
MNPFRNGVDVNQTEVECTRIREKELTKRARLEEREKTKRERSQRRGDGWVIPWLGAVVVTIGGLIVLGVFIQAKYPTCEESSQIMSDSGNPRMDCPAGAWAETKPVDGAPGKVLVQCLCKPKPHPFE